MDDTTPQSGLYAFVDSNLYRLPSGTALSQQLINQVESDLVDPANISSGVFSQNLNVQENVIQGGKTLFDNSESGFILGADQGVYKFYIGNSTKYIDWDGTNLSVVGGVSISSLDIPDKVTANSFHVDTAGNTWWGATAIGSAVGKVLNTGAATFSNMTITGGSVATTTLNKGLQNWSTDIVFTSASATQINWASGHIITQDGTTYNISAGNTGTMAALTYIYLDIAVSITVLQTTTTYSTATGDGKIS